jgi:hypothetical protein
MKQRAAWAGLAAQGIDGGAPPPMLHVEHFWDVVSLTN